ncbi:hypothetical protein AB0J48_20740 [Nocardia salmonicida]|uniref:hypothetical protein n=1 Tax=Nocardia salmonicida TaxID=53431 RepID=UPI00342E8694
MKLLPSLRPSAFGRHTRHDFAEPRVTVAELLARRDAENSKAKVKASHAWPSARLAAENADTQTLPVVVDAELVDAETVPPLRKIPSFIVREREDYGLGSKVLVSANGFAGGAR